MKTYIFSDEKVISYNVFDLNLDEGEKFYYTEDEDCNMMMNIEVSDLPNDLEHRIKKTIKDKFDSFKDNYDKNYEIFKMVGMDPETTLINKIKFSSKYSIYKMKIKTKSYFYTNFLKLLWNIITGKVFDKKQKEIYSIVLKYKLFKV